MIRNMRALDVQARPFAAVAVTTRISLWPQQFGQSLDKVWKEIRAGRIKKAGHNVMVYRHRDDGLVDIECGVETRSRFDSIGEVVLRETPAGLAVTATHVGPYQELSASWDAVAQWARAHAFAATNTCWEIYGDWNEDPAKLETELFLLVKR